MLYRLIHCCLYFTVRSLSKWTVGKYCWFFYLPVSRFSTAFREEDRQVSVGMEKPTRNVQKVTTTKERSSVAFNPPPPPPPPHLGKSSALKCPKEKRNFRPDMSAKRNVLVPLRYHKIETKKLGKKEENSKRKGLKLKN